MVVKAAEAFGYPVSCIRVVPESDKFFCSTIQGFVLEGSTEQGSYKTYIEGIRVCRRNIPETPRSLLEGENEINSLDLSSELDYLVTGGRDSIIRVYDANLGKVLLGHEDFVSGLIFGNSSFTGMEVPTGRRKWVISHGCSA